MTSSYHLAYFSCCTFVVNRLREMLPSLSFLSFSQEDHSKLCSSEHSCFLEDSEASFVPCDKDLKPLATQEVASAHESKTALEALSLNSDLLHCYAMISFHYLQNRIIETEPLSQANDELEQYINPELSIAC